MGSVAPYRLGQQETIAAPITAAGSAAIAVVRVSGPLTATVITELCGQGAKILASPRELHYTQIYDLPRATDSSQSSNPGPTRPLVLDWGLIAFFNSPKSFTGEDCAEFNLHGSPYLVARLLENLNQLGVRLARPGEFSERAFWNGQIDLSQAEAIADLIAAETAAQANVAREQLEGKLSDAVALLGEPLRNLLAEIEAHIDFPEEGIEPLTAVGWGKVLAAVQGELERLLQTFRFGRLCREGAGVVLAGLPNAGKSSLLNRLLGEERAIVTPIPGTTRDSIEERISLDGLAVRLCDTAGLEELQPDLLGIQSQDSAPAIAPSVPQPARSIDLVERLGIERSWSRIEQGDLVLFVVDACDISTQAAELLSRIKSRARRVLVVLNKVDLLPAAGPSLAAVTVSKLPTPDELTVPVSALTGAGITDLRRAIIRELCGEDSGVTPPAVVVTNQRHFTALSSCAQALAEAVLAIKQELAPEFVAVHLREALCSLEEIVGATPTEEILGRIFSKFCIGK